MFPIGVWFEGKPQWADSPGDPAGAKAYYARCFSDLADRGFNTVTVTNCPEPLWDALLTSAAEHGLKIVLDVLTFSDLIDRPSSPDPSEIDREVRRVAELAGGYESLWRYQTRDEPAPQMIENWAAVNRTVARVDPDHPPFACFCNPDAMELAMSVAPPDEAVFDIYPHWIDVPVQDLGHYAPLLDRFVSAAGDRSKWIVLATCAKPTWSRYPTIDELRCEVYLALAAGVSGFFFFIYQFLPRHPEQLMGLVTPEGRPTRFYGQVTELVDELAKIGPLVAGATRTGLCDDLRTKVSVCTFHEQNGRAIFIPNVVKGDIRLGSFRASGRDVLIIAGTRPGRDSIVRIERSDLGRWTDAVTGEAFGGSETGLELVLDRGVGRVLLWENV